MRNPNTDIKHSLQRKQCFGNFCQLEHPDCRFCAIDDALDELEMRLENDHFYEWNQPVKRTKEHAQQRKQTI